MAIISNNWMRKTWLGLTSFYGSYVWRDGDNIYYSDGTTQYKLNPESSTWTAQTWRYINVNSLYGINIWTDGTDIYTSNGATHFRLNRGTNTWYNDEWPGIYCTGQYVWTDGTDTYYSSNSTNPGYYVWDKPNKRFIEMTWSGLTSFIGNMIWTDGTNTYYSYGTNQYVLDKANHHWNPKTWSGLTSFNGNNVWTDGTDIYYSALSTQYILNKTTGEWSLVRWTGYSRLSGQNIWSIGDNYYFSNSGTQYEAKAEPAPEPPEPTGGKPVFLYTKVIQDGVEKLRWVRSRYIYTRINGAWTNSSGVPGSIKQWYYYENGAWLPCPCVASYTHEGKPLWATDASLYCTSYGD